MKRYKNVYVNIICADNLIAIQNNTRFCCCNHEPVLCNILYYIIHKLFIQMYTTSHTGPNYIYIRAKNVFVEKLCTIKV